MFEAVFLARAIKVTGQFGACMPYHLEMPDPEHGVRPSIVRVEG
jgi:hypothetical protein